MCARTRLMVRIQKGCAYAHRQQTRRPLCLYHGRKPEPDGRQDRPRWSRTGCALPPMSASAYAHRRIRARARLMEETRTGCAYAHGIHAYMAVCL